MKKILFMDHASVLGGSQIVLLNYLKYFDRYRFKVFVATSDDQPFFTSKLMKYSTVVKIRFGRLKTSPFYTLIRFVQSVHDTVNFIKKEKIDVVLSNTERAMYVGTVASLLTRTKLVWFVRDFRYNRILFLVLSVFPRRIFFVSRAVGRHYLSFRQGEVIYVSSDMYKRALKVTESDVKEFKEKYSLVGKFVVGYVGRLSDEKGYKVLLEAMKGIGDDVVCILVGIGESRGKNAKEVSGGNVVFTGFLESTPLAYRSLDVFIHPATSPEPFATTIVEAMMAKVPVVATRIGGTLEIVRDSVTGILIEPGNSKSIADAIRRLKSDEKLRNTLSRKAYRISTGKYKIEKEVSLLQETLLSL